MQTLRKIVTGVFVGVFLISMAVGAAAQDTFSTEPVTNNGQKWRIGYYEGGPYNGYQRNLLMTIKGLMDLGWIEPAEIPPQQGEQTKELWNWLNTTAQSEYLDFVADAHYSADWEEATREVMAAEIITRLSTQNDIDLMLALGSWAGLDLANDQHATPTVIMGTANPLKSGIIESIEDSGRDHIHARIDPTRYERQICIFHDIIGFNKLGIFYEDTVSGRTYAAVDLAEKIAAEAGFEVVHCIARSDVPVPQAKKEALACVEQLCQEADAIYMPTHGGKTPETISEFVELVNDYGIPTFSQEGSEEVKAGFLLSISMAGFKYVGEFYAQTIAKILNGAKPRDLDQVFEDPPKIAINLKTAEIINYDPPVDVLGAADEIYQEIE